MGRKNYASAKTARELRKTVRFIDKQQYELDMMVGICVPETQADTDTALLNPECGTAACFAGSWLLMTSPKDVSFRSLPDIVGYGHWGDDDFRYEFSWEIIRDRARRGMGLDHDEAQRIFNLDNWPHSDKSAFRRAKSRQERVAALRERIEKFICIGD